MSDFQWGMLGLLVVMTGIYIWAELYARRVLGPRNKSDPASPSSPPNPAE